MNIKGTATGEIVAITLKKNLKHDAKTATVDLLFQLKRPKLAQLFGADLDAMTFASMITVDDKITHLADAVKPGSKATYEIHDIVIGDVAVGRVQPKIVRNRPVQGEESSAITVRVPVPTDDAARLMTADGAVKVQFNPAQQDLPGVAA